MKRFLSLQVAIAFTASLLCAQETVEQWQKKTVQDFPEIGIAGSPMNTKFIQSVTSLKSSNPALFNDPKWPYIIAEQVANVKNPGQGIIPGVEVNPQNGPLDAPKIAAEYKGNQRVADAKYFGKKIEINGEILRIVRPDNSTSAAFVYLKTENGLPCIKLELNKMKKYAGTTSNGTFYSNKDGYEFRVTDNSALEVRSHKRTFNRYPPFAYYSHNTIQNGDWVPIISKGEKIKVMGMCSGLKYDIVFNACELQRDDDDLP
jgi:hypothetical protein